MRRVPIEEFLIQGSNTLLLDVRSPGEYDHAHMPGAISLPLFTDEERKVVGTTYKQVSREAAIKIGLDYFGPKMRGMVEEVEQLIVDRWPLTEKKAEKNIEQKNREQVNDERKGGREEPQTPNPKPQIFLYCWRGGMRSGAVAWLLNLYGFDVTVLAGGYKAYRNWVLQSIAQPYRLQLVGGYTGSGKTALLKELEERGEAVINLEELASHKGSAFGNIGMPEQPSQEMFENMLSCKLQAASGKQGQTDLSLPFRGTGGIWIEDESQRIGHINLPKPFWDTMRRSPVYFIDIPFEERLENLVRDYGSLDRERMVAAIERISKRLGPLETKTAIQHLQDGNVKECFRILLHYYDKHYLKGLHNRENLASLLTKIPCEKVSVDNAALVSQAQHTTYAGTN